MSENDRTPDARNEKAVPPENMLPDLKTLREEKGLTIEDIFLKTRISPAFLTAIENNEFQTLPEPFYARKFIQIYAEMVGADAGMILARYQHYLNGEQVASRAETPIELPSSKTHRGLRSLMYLVPAMAVVAALACILLYQEQKPQEDMQRGTNRGGAESMASPLPPPAPEAAPRSSPQPAPETVSPLPSAMKEQRPLETMNKASGTPTPAAIPKETARIQGVAELTLRIEALDDTWINVRSDNKTSYQVTLKAGETLRRTAREFFLIDVGNAAGAKITFQGKSLGSLGEEGQVVHIRLPQQ